jgi:hypothetical protein
MTGSTPRSGTIAALLLLLSSVGAAAAAPAPEPPPVFQGTWIATAAPAQVFHGRWAAQAIPGRLDDVQGSWSMVNDAGDVIAQGTWSAQRSTRGLKGKWSARGATGALYRGTFEAHLPGFKGKTLQDMFAETRTKQISGFWRTSGGARGAWYFKGEAPKETSPSP